MTRHANAAMLEEVHAYQQEQEEAAATYVIPPYWTVAEVARRLVEAADVLRRMRMRIGPKAYGSNWPQIQHDKADTNDVQAYIQMQEDRRIATLREAEMPSAEEISRMEEALRWPAIYLTHVIDADAVTLWATFSAHKMSIKAELARRKRAAKERALKEQKAENDRREALRRQEAAKVAAWANERLAGADGPRAANIRANAQIRLQRACEGLKPVAAKAVSPDQAIGPTNFYVHLKYAFDVITGKLLEEGVIFRPAPLDDERDPRKRRILEAA